LKKIDLENLKKFQDGGARANLLPAFMIENNSN